MKTLTAALPFAVFAHPALAHADAQFHSHGPEPLIVLAAIGLMLAAAGTARWALSR